jgi:RecA/RadA recombinase
MAGESGSGKSYLCSGNIASNAQKSGIFVVLIDTENALDESWLHALDVDTSPEKLLKVSASMIDDVAKFISDFVKDYKAQYAELPRTERPKVLFIIDSLGMLMSPTDVNQFDSGLIKGDMGRTPKALKALVKNCVNMFGDLNIGLIGTNHTYASQDQFSPDDKISGGSGFVYASSIVITIKKFKLKEDETGNKVSDVNGIRAQCTVVKTRYNKPFEKIEIKIPYDKGMDPYSGLFDMFETIGIIEKDGTRYKYQTPEGETIKEFRKNYTNEMFNNIMANWNYYSNEIEKNITEARRKQLEDSDE